MQKIAESLPVDTDSNNNKYFMSESEHNYSGSNSSCMDCCEKQTINNSLIEKDDEQERIIESNRKDTRYLKKNLYQYMQKASIQMSL